MRYSALGISSQNVQCALAFPVACRALPVSPEVASSQQVLRRFLILAVTPVSKHGIRCYSSQRVSRADRSVIAVRALCASCSAGHSCCPNMWLAGGTLVAVPHSLDITVWLDPRCMFPTTCHCCCSSGFNMLLSEALPSA